MITRLRWKKNAATNKMLAVLSDAYVFKETFSQKSV
jgi:hypothetical protein